MFEVIYYKAGKKDSTEFTKEKKAIKFAMKVKGIVLKGKEIIDDFSD